MGSKAMNHPHFIWLLPQSSWSPAFNELLTNDKARDLLLKKEKNKQVTTTYLTFNSPTNAKKYIT
jgi:hypothetical protein